jgi:hypothetical protein
MVRPRKVVMAKRLMTAVQAPKPGQGATLDVPQDVKDEIDGLFAHLTEHPDQEGFITFEPEDGQEMTDVVKEKNRWLSQVRSYARTREAGALNFRQLPSKHLPDNQVRFSLKRDIPADGERNAKPGPVSETPATTPKGRKAK